MMTPVMLALAGCLLALRISGLAAQLEQEVEGESAAVSLICSYSPCREEQGMVVW